MSFYLQSRGKSFDDVEELIKFLYDEKDPRSLLLECIKDDSFFHWVTENGSPGASSVWRVESEYSQDPDISIANHLYLLELAAPEYRRRILYICSRLLQQLPEYWLMNHMDCYKTQNSQAQEILDRCQTFSSRTTKSTKDYLTLVVDLKNWQSSLAQQMMNCYPLYENNYYVREDANIFCDNISGYFVNDQEDRNVAIGYLKEQKDSVFPLSVQTGIKQQINEALSVLKHDKSLAASVQEKGTDLQKLIQRDYRAGGFFSNIFSILYIFISILAAAHGIILFLAASKHGSAPAYMLITLLFTTILCIQSSVKRLIRNRKWHELNKVVKEIGTIIKKFERLIEVIGKDTSAWEKKSSLSSKGTYYPPIINKLSSKIDILNPGLQKKNHTKKCFLLLIMAWMTVVTLLADTSDFTSSAKSTSNEETAAAEPASVSYRYTPYDDVDPETLNQVQAASAEASSTLVSSRGASYDASKVTDNDLSTSWQEAADGYGIGEWVRLNFDEVTSVKMIRMKLGSWVSSDKYLENGRPSKITLVLENESQEWGRMTQELDDVMDNQCITFDTPIQCSSIQFIIEDVYPGSKYEETVITELSIYN